MGISYISEAHTTETAYVSSISVNRPANYAAGDLFIAIVGGTRSGSTPTGWTQLGTSTVGSSTGTLYVYYKIAGGSESSSYSFDTSGSSNQHLAIAQILCYRGADSSTPIDTTHFNLATASGTNFNTASVAASGQQWALSFAMGYKASSTVPTYTFGSGTQRGSTQHSNQSTNENTSLAMCDSNSDVSAGSFSRTQSLSSGADAGAKGILLINEGGVSVTLGSDGVASDNHATAYATTVLIQTVQAASASTLGHNTSVGFEVNADEAAEPSVVAHDATRPIFPADAEVDADAEEASVHLDVNVRHADADATAFDASGYYGAATVRVYVVPDENRTYKVER